MEGEGEEESSDSEVDEFTMRPSSEHIGKRPGRKKKVTENASKAAHLVWAPAIMSWIQATRGLQLADAFRVWAVWVRHWGSREELVGVAKDAEEGMWVVPAKGCHSDVARESMGEAGKIVSVSKLPDGRDTCKVHWITTDAVCGPYSIPNRWDLVQQKEEEEEVGGHRREQNQTGAESHNRDRRRSSIASNVYSDVEEEEDHRFSLAVANEREIEEAQNKMAERKYVEEMEVAKARVLAERESLIEVEPEVYDEDEKGEESEEIEGSEEDSDEDHELVANFTRRNSQVPSPTPGGMNALLNPRTNRSSRRLSASKVVRGNKRHRKRVVYAEMLPRPIVKNRLSLNKLARPVDDFKAAQEAKLDDPNRTPCRLLRDKEVNTLPGAVRSESLVQKGSLLVLPPGSGEAETDLQDQLEKSQTVTLVVKDNNAAAGGGMSLVLETIQKSLYISKKAVDRSSAARSLTSLVLTRVPMSQSEVKLLVKKVLLDKDSQLRNLYMTRNGLGDAGVKILCEAFSSRPVMKGREIDRDARRKPASETLAQIFIQGNGVTDKGVSMIAKACLFSPTIKRIDLSDNKLTDRGASSLCDLIYRNEAINFLSVTDNKGITDVGKRMLREACGRKHAFQRDMVTIFGPSTNPTLARRVGSDSVPDQNNTPRGLMHLHRGSVVTPWHQRRLTNTSQLGLSFDDSALNYGQELENKSTEIGSFGRKSDMSKGGSEKSMDSGSDIVFTRKKRAIGPSQPPEMMSSRDTFSEEFYSAQGSRGVAALKDKDRLIRDHVIHRNRFAIEQQLRKKRLEDVQKARDRLRAEIHEIKREKPEGYEHLLERLNVEYDWFTKDLKSKLAAQMEAADQKDQEVIEYLYLKESVVPLGSFLEFDQVRPPAEYVSMFKKALKGEAGGKNGQGQRAARPWDDDETCEKNFEISRNLSQSCIRIDYDLAAAINEANDGAWHHAQLYPEIPDGLSYCEFYVDSSVGPTCQLMIGVAILPMAVPTDPAIVLCESSDAMLFYAVDGSLCSNSVMSAGAKDNRGFSQGDTIGVLVRHQGCVGNVTFHVNGTEVLTAPLPENWQQDSLRSGIASPNRRAPGSPHGRTRMTSQPNETSYSGQSSPMGRNASSPLATSRDARPPVTGTMLVEHQKVLKFVVEFGLPDQRIELCLKKAEMVGEEEEEADIDEQIHRSLSSEPA